MIGRELIPVLTALKSINLKGSSVPDLQGAPMNVSAIINYRITDSLQATYGVVDLNQYIENQGLEVLRSTCSKFSYRSNDPNELSLLSSSK